MVWLVVLLGVAGVGLIFCEIFVPGGVIGAFGVACLIGSIVVAVMNFSTAGIVLTVLLIPIAGIVAGIVAFRVLRKTPLGKSVFLSSTQKGVDVLSGSADEYARLIGKRGVAHSYLRPAGVADIEGERVDVVTEGEFVSAGTPIEVLCLEGNHLVVRTIKVEEENKS